MKNKIIIFVLTYFLSLNLYSADEYDVTFYNVGQGNCVILKSHTTQNILFVDAGSSSTIGVVNEGLRDKNEHLAQNIVDYIRHDLEESQTLHFIISHADRDHLNLVKPIISSFFGLPDDPSSLSKYQKSNILKRLKKYKISALFGGCRGEYEKGDGSILIDFMEDYGIPFWFSTNHFRQDSDRLYFVPKNDRQSARINDLWESEIKYFSIDGRYSGKKDNATSIVMKIKLGDSYLTLTGDKTKDEIKAIIDAFREAGRLNELETTMLLSTHHGSGIDFNQEWLDSTKPHYVIFSSGRSNYLHPQREAIAGSLAHLSVRRNHLNQNLWHFIQFHGDYINADHTHSVFREYADYKDSAQGYTHAITDRAMYVTAGKQRYVRFKLSMTDVRVFATEYDDYTAALETFLAEPSLYSGAALRISNVLFENIRSEDVRKLSEHIEALEPEIRELHLKRCELDTTEGVETIAHLIDVIQGISKLNISGHTFSEDQKEIIKKAWDARGIVF